MVRRRSSRQFLVARSRCTKFRDARYFIPDEICTDMWRRSDRLNGGRKGRRREPKERKKDVTVEEVRILNLCMFLCRKV